jgi:hypothetical protein
VVSVDSIAAQVGRFPTTVIIFWPPMLEKHGAELTARPIFASHMDACCGTVSFLL